MLLQCAADVLILPRRPLGKSHLLLTIEVMGTAERTTRVMFIEDQELVREGLAIQIAAQQDLCVVAAAATKQSALASIGSASPDVLLISTELVGEDAFAVLSFVRLIWPHIHALMLASAVRDGVVLRAMDFNVKGFVTKYDSFATLLRGIRSVAAGRRFYSSRIDARLDRIETRAALQGAVSLTRRELEVMIHLVAGCTVGETADQLGIARTTVDNHKTRLMRKVDVHSSVELTRYAIREGLIDP